MVKVSSITLAELLESLPGGPEGKAARQVSRAYDFASSAHSDRHRDSGERYIEHDLAVAKIMVQLGVDTNTIIASLLHDSLYPHTGKGAESIKALFDQEVASLVVGLKNLQAFAEKESYRKHERAEDGQTLEGIRRAILSIIEGDIRVILIRIADCLQNLRKASQLPPNRQYSIANEAMNIYGPLANRLGVWQLKWELEDLAFRYLEPERYKEIARKLAETRIERTEKIEVAINRLRSKIRAMGLKAEVTGRSKHIYSIYRKMERKGLELDQIYDIEALRVILWPKDPEEYSKKNTREKDEEDRGLCYQVLGAVHSLWQPIPREFDDYIATPKSNGYKSLHTAVVDGDTGQSLEVQIRSQRMHDEAEKGIASHWAYKEDGTLISASVQKRIQGLRDLLINLRDTDSATSENEIFETEVLADRIYAFTPNGDVLELPAGSTPIDFAYQVHTEVGHRCRGARVDGKMVGLDYALQSGQRVEILTSKRGGPSRDWMNSGLGYTGSARSRSKIRQWFRTQEREKNIQQGREVVERELKRLGLTEIYEIVDIAEALGFEEVEQFLAKVGFGDIQSTQISGAIAVLKRELEPDDELSPLLQVQPKPKGLTVLGLSGLHTKMAGCCHPIPPEPVIGYITRGQGVTIHRQDCNQLEAITDRERLIEVGWGSVAETYPIPIVVKAYRRPHLVEDIASILRGQQISTPKTKTMMANSIVTLYLVVEVISLDQLNWLLQKIENLPNVFEAQRQRWS